MQPVVETLSGLERRIDLQIAIDEIEKNVDQRLKKMARTARMPGFRPGKVPMPMLARTYGPELRFEAINEKVGEAFANAVKAAELRVAGAPKVEPKEGDADPKVLAFSATFEVYPQISVPDLSALAVEKTVFAVTDAEIDRTIEILRKQRRTFGLRAAAEGATEGDRVTIDFEGKIDGEPFAGGQASDFQFIVGEGQMLAQFDEAVRGMKAGESKTFPLQFPADYQGQEVAGKEADFLVTVKKIEAAHLPDVDDAFAKTLGIKEGTVEALRTDVKKKKIKRNI